MRVSIVILSVAKNLKILQSLCSFRMTGKARKARRSSGTPFCSSPLKPWALHLTTMQNEVDVLERCFKNVAVIG